MLTVLKQLGCLPCRVAQMLMTYVPVLALINHNHHGAMASSFTLFGLQWRLWWCSFWNFKAFFQLPFTWSFGILSWCCFPYSYPFWFSFCLHYDLIRIYQILPYSETSDCRFYLIKVLIVYNKSVCWAKQWVDSSKSLSMDLGSVCKPETMLRLLWGRRVFLYSLACTQDL